MIRVEALWLSIAPAGKDTLLAQVVWIFGEARPHHAYLTQPSPIIPTDLSDMLSRPVN